ncbi:MAG: hypothetical protein SGJ17_05665 [Hyphomicrobiales bacterium]|nr:hypothetical protein [Hyphomicrobiales bacterium]
MYSSDHIGMIVLQRDTIRQWLEDEAPYTEFDQRHLNGGSPEQAYWNHGYQAALQDLLNLLTTSVRTSRTEGTSSAFPHSAPDESGSPAD